MTGFVVQGHICSLFNSDDFITYCTVISSAVSLNKTDRTANGREVRAERFKVLFHACDSSAHKECNAPKNGRRRSDSSARSRSSRPPRAWRHRRLELFVLDCGRERARASSQQNKEGKQTSSLYTYATRLFLIKRPSMCCVVSRNGQAR